MADPLGAVCAIRNALASDIDVIILGGLAANAYRLVPRTTQDADLLLSAAIRSAIGIERLLVDGGFVRPPGRRVYRVGRFEWRRLLWPLPDPDDPTIVDLFFSGADPRGAAFITSVAQRAVVTRVGGQTIRVASPEDIIVLKALAIASGTRGPKAVTDADDIRSMRDNRALKLDLDYIRSQALALGMARVIGRLLGPRRDPR